MKVAPSDSNLFVRVHGDILAIVLVYVDDLIITEMIKKRSDKYERRKEICFQMKKLGEL